MRLLAIEWLWTLWLVPVAALLLRLGAVRARTRTREFVGALAPRLVRAGGEHLSRSVFALAAVAVAIVALARPAWGVVMQDVEREGLELVVLLDVSRSMLAEDAAPNRLERARLAVGRLIDRLEESGGHRIGLVAFAGLPVVRAPVTSDYAYVRDRLATTSPSDVPRGGTLIGDAVRRSVGLLDRGDVSADVPVHDRVVILLTDGEDHESFPREAAQGAAEAGVVIYSVGIGDPSDGGRIPIRGDDGRRSFVSHGGSDVVSRLDEDTLRAMATSTGGGYLPAGTRSIPLDRLYDEAIQTRRAASLGTTRERRHHERFQWAAGIALVLAILSRVAGPRGRDA